MTALFVVSKKISRRIIERLSTMRQAAVRVQGLLQTVQWFLFMVMLLSAVGIVELAAAIPTKETVVPLDHVVGAAFGASSFHHAALHQ